MDTIIFHKPEYYENYILGKLSDKDEELFEEHLLVCPYCQEQLLYFEQLIAATKSYSPEKQNQYRKITPATLKWFSIAASVLLVIGLSLVFYSSDKDTNIVQETGFVKDTLKKIQEKQKIIVTDKKQPTKIAEKKVQLKNDSAYRINPVFENAIQNITRSSSVEIISPKTSKIYACTDSIVFNWKSNSEHLMLVVFNNTGEILFEKPVAIPFCFHKQLSAGLYYWQVENEDEALFTGKFSVK
jgi:uncharacterized protein YbaR (Trm112 family)